MEQTAVREAKNAYQREWNKRNKEKVKEYQDRYWAKKAKEMEQQQEESTS